LYQPKVVNCYILVMMPEINLEMERGS